jgi:hypothetical protein
MSPFKVWLSTTSNPQFESQLALELFKEIHMQHQTALGDGVGAELLV